MSGYKELFTPWCANRDPETGSFWIFTQPNAPVLQQSLQITVTWSLINATQGDSEHTHFWHFFRLKIVFGRAAMASICEREIVTPMLSFLEENYFLAALFLATLNVKKQLENKKLHHRKELEKLVHVKPGPRLGGPSLWTAENDRLKSRFKGQNCGTIPLKSVTPLPKNLVWKPFWWWMFNLLQLYAISKLQFSLKLSLPEICVTSPIVHSLNNAAGSIVTDENWSQLHFTSRYFGWKILHTNLHCTDQKLP